MRFIIKWVLIGICLTVTASGQTVDIPPSPNLQEAIKLHTQVSQLYSNGKYDEAIPIAKRVIEIREKELKPDDHLLATSYQNLGYLYRAIQRYYDAEKALRKAIKIEETRLGKEHPDLLDLIVDTAWICNGQGKFNDAEILFKQSIVILEKQYNAMHPEIGRGLINLARLYEKNSQPKKAIPLYERLIAIRVKAFGETSQETKEAIEYCACVLEQNQQPEEGRTFWERAWGIEKSLHPKGELAQVGVLRGKATKKVEPSYPDYARGARVEGVVIVNVIINEDGKVVQAKRLCGPDLLAKVSEEAAKKWEFVPVMHEGKPVKVQGNLTFNFKL